MSYELSDSQRHDAAGAILTIDLAALRANYRSIAERISPTRVAAVVKADAYGLGAVMVAPEFYNAGCRDFFVAHLMEALELRPHLPDDATIYILNGLQPNTEEICAAAGITPVLNSLQQLNNWARLGRERSISLPALLQIDSGMARLGLSPEELDVLVAAPEMLEGIDVKFIMSHLACADDPANLANAAQLVRFQAALKSLPAYPAAFANSGGTFLGDSFHFDLARPGIALYGGAPQSGTHNPMQAAVRLDAKIIQTRSVPAGSAVGYSGSYVTSRPTRIATIAVGYADGWSRHLSDKGAAYYNGTRLPIIGRVSMDSITLDISELPADTLNLGSLVELIGPNQTLEQVATDCGTIAYEVLTSLGQRYYRQYINQAAS